MEKQKKKNLARWQEAGDNEDAREALQKTEKNEHIIFILNSC